MRALTMKQIREKSSSPEMIVRGRGRRYTYINPFVPAADLYIKWSKKDSDSFYRSMWRMYESQNHVIVSGTYRYKFSENESYLFGKDGKIDFSLYFPKRHKDPRNNVAIKFCFKYIPDYLMQIVRYRGIREIIQGILYEDIFIQIPEKKKFNKHRKWEPRLRKYRMLKNLQKD